MCLHFFSETDKAFAVSGKLCGLFTERVERAGCRKNCR